MAAKKAETKPATKAKAAAKGGLDCAPAAGKSAPKGKSKGK